MSTAATFKVKKGFFFLLYEELKRKKVKYDLLEIGRSTLLIFL